MTLLFNILFLIFTIYILFKNISYGLYEINQEKNKSGGITVIALTVVSIIFSNIIMWIN